MKKYLVVYLLFIAFKSFGQTVVLSSPTQNKFYKWVENQFEIHIENASCSDIIVKASVGIVKKNACHFKYTIEEIPTNEVKLSIGLKRKEGVKWIEDRYFKIQPLPFPKIIIPTIQNNKISKTQINLSHRLMIPDYTFGFEAIDSKIFSLDTFTITIFRQDTVLFKRESIAGNEIPSEVISYINNHCRNNDELLISNFRISIYKRERLQLPQIITLVYVE